MAKNRRNLNDRTLSFHLHLCNMSLLVASLLYVIVDDIAVSTMIGNNLERNYYDALNTSYKGEMKEV